jgi:hypothetical protein
MISNGVKCVQLFYGQQVLSRSAGEPSSQAATIALLSTSPAARIGCFDWKNRYTSARDIDISAKSRRTPLGKSCGP